MSSGTVGQRHHGGTDSDSHRPDSRFPGSRRPLRTSRYAVSPRVWVSSTTVGARHFHHHEAPSSCWSIATPPLAPPTRPPPSLWHRVICRAMLKFCFFTNVMSTESESVSFGDSRFPPADKACPHRSRWRWGLAGLLFAYS